MRFAADAVELELAVPEIDPPEGSAPPIAASLADDLEVLVELVPVAVKADHGIETVQQLFRFVWRDGSSSDDSGAWHDLVTRLGIADADAVIASADVKTKLKANGEQATARGVFGVPTFVTQDGELFWGEDATDMLLDYLARAPVFGSDEMRRADDMPMAAQRIPLAR